jgi:hypothetical protein
MTNTKLEVIGNQLVIKINLDETHGKSASGKTNVIGTTHGFTNIDYKGESILVSLNVCKK